MMWYNRQGQNWTIDLLVAVVIFMSVSIFFYTMVQNNLQQETSFDQSSEQLVDKLNAQNYPEDYNATPLPLQGYSINHTEMKSLYKKDYETVKRQLNIDGEFCMTVVKPDGSLVAFNVSGNETYSFGSGDGQDMVADDIHCGE